MRRIKKTKYYSQVLGDMPTGCKQCVNGEKLVLFITGVCNSGCYYCPLSEQKKDKDHVWANEWKIQKKQDILEEAKLCSSKGAGITGGDPFLKVDRVVSSVRMLKKEFGDDFHVHLYAPLINITNGRLKRIYNSGLDEIRFHPDIRNDENWDKIEAARKYKWKIGVEIPVIPDKKKETIRLINYIKNKVDFLNLNELEISDTNACKLSEKGYKTKDNISYGIEKSEETAKDILDYCRKLKINVHYCSARLKDGIQLAERIKRRANNVKRDFDKVSKDGTLIRGAIYLKDLVPGAGYRLQLETIINKRAMVKKLYKIKKDLQAQFNIRNNMIDVDKDKLRLLVSSGKIKDIDRKIKRMGLVPALVEEYPTYDNMEIEVNLL